MGSLSLTDTSSTSSLGNNSFSSTRAKVVVVVVENLEALEDFSNKVADEN